MRKPLNRVSLMVGISGRRVSPARRRWTPSGNIHYYYEVEPLGVYLVEILTGSNITVFYESGEDLVKAR